MLSAIAARKAAKAAAEASRTPSSKPPSPSPPSQSPSPSPKPSTSSKPENKSTSKRKTRTHAGPSKNKKVKVLHPPTNHDRAVRYFDQGDTSIAQNDNLPGEIEDDSSDTSSSSEGEMEIEMDIPPPVGPMSSSVTKIERAWSPSQPVADSSSDEEPAINQVPAPRKPKPSTLSTFRPVFNKNVFPSENKYPTGGKAVVLVLQPHETIALLGTYTLCILRGGLSVLGVILSPSNTKHTVFAPRSSPLPILSWATPVRQSSCTFPVPQAIRQKENVTAVLIECIRTGVEGLGRICRVFEDTFKPPRESDAAPVLDLPGVHMVSSSTKDIHPFVLPTSWDAALAPIDEHPGSEISTAPVCLVKGPKKSGKSTLARILVNRLLTRYRRVAFLECDLGQSEFTPGGLVALNLVENHVFGPPFSHPSLPYRAHYIGSTSPRTSPSYYLHSIRNLLETYKLDFQFPAPTDEPPLDDERIYDAIPLVVNTMGWTKGLGADLNARIEEFIEATHTFDIDGPEEKGWPAPFQPQPPPQLPAVSPFVRSCARKYLKVDAIPTEMTNMHRTATDHRHLNILSYFHAVFSELPTSSNSLSSSLKQITATHWETSLSLCAQYPYEVDYTQAFDHVYLTGSGYEDVVPSELTRVLNGAIVGLVSDGHADSLSRPTQSASQEMPLLSYVPGEQPPDPASSTCHGLALIRGMPLLPSPRSPHMHVLTPLPTGLLAQTRVLVKGEMELPIWGMLNFREDDEGQVLGVDKGPVPYLQWGKGEGVGSEKRRVRRNLMRKAQM